METTQILLTHSAPLEDNLPAHLARCLEAILYLEMCKLNYQRQISKYNINYFATELELPMLRYDRETTRNVIDFMERKHTPSLNSKLELSDVQKADVTALQSLIRDRLHLVFLHQVYANEDNWKEYSNQMSHYLPFLLKRWLLAKERQNALEILTRNHIMTTAHAKELLSECLSAIFEKMNDGNLVKREESKVEDHGIGYFFGKPSTLDAVLCSELVLLNCCQLPHRYLKDIKDNRKVKSLLKYSETIMTHFKESIKSKLTSQNQIEPIPVLTAPKQFSKPSQAKKEAFYNKLLDTDEEKNSVLFIVGSVTAFCLYWYRFQAA
eukprot:328059_1